jgi:CRP/FNR family cyclic AMP-dependent transcriptional regulator
MPALLTEGSLKNHPFLAGTSSEFLNLLEEFSKDVTFEKGDVILVEGEYADRFYLISEGRVQLDASCDGSPRLMFQVLGPGDVLGWSWLYPPFEWHFSARAIEPCKAIELNAASLLIRAEDDPVFGYELMKRISLQLVQRLQAARTHLAREVNLREGCD